MPNDYVYLRMHRKRSNLTQDDLAFLLGLVEKSRVSHWEKGRRVPNLDVFILCHLIFNLPIDSLLQQHQKETTEALKKRIQQLIDKLLSEHPNPKIVKRIEFLQTTLSRLSE